MSDFTEFMGELLELGMNANPTCPFTACIIDGSGQILVTACNATHISPLYSAESLALHIIASEFDCSTDHPLTLVATAEMDESSLAALFRAKRRGINITELVYGASREDLKKIWKDDPSRSLSIALESYPKPFRDSLTIHPPVLREECVDAFSEGAELKRSGEAPVKSLDLDQYWMTEDWLLDDWEDILEE